MSPGSVLVALTTPLSLVAVACGGPVATAEETATGGEGSAPTVAVADADWDDDAARAAFTAFEARLAEASTLHVAFETTGEGAVVSTTRGVLELGGDNQVRVEAEGQFQGHPIAPILISDGERMIGGNDDRRFEEPTPPALTEAVLIGFTRMGVLHNIATLAGGAPPDRSEGGAFEWVTTSHHRAVHAQSIEGVETRSVAFMIQVGGAPAAEATLHLDAETMLPRLREQVVRFDEGEMRVTERYREMTLDKPIDEARFTPDG